MRTMSFAIIAGALIAALGVLAPSAATAQEAVFVAPTGNVGMGTASPMGKLHVFENVDAQTYVLIENINTGLDGAAISRVQTNTAQARFIAHGSGRTLSRFGQTLASWTELLGVSGNGLIIGTMTDKPLILGTNLTNRLQIGGTGGVTVSGDFTVRLNAAGEAVSRLQNLNAAGYSGIEYYDNNGNAGAFFGLDNANSNTRLNSFFNKPLVILTNSVERARFTSTGDIGIGTSAPSSRLHVNGGDIRVSGGSFIDDGTTLNAPDYVFEPGYDLMPLDELQAFIAREKHLPNVPSAREVKEQGLNLSHFQMRLLEKIEELTLHVIAHGNEIERLRSRNAELEGGVEESAQDLGAELRAQVAALEQALGTPGSGTRQ